MKIKIIAPHDPSDTSISSGELFRFQKVNLPLLASLTPPEHSVCIVDEAFAPDDPHQDVDLVGITVMTGLASRAYTIADTYRDRGIKVVLGGIHVTVRPSEALKHADAVVLGEAEETWPKAVIDAGMNRLQKMYRASGLTDLCALPLPKRHLYPASLNINHFPIGTGVEASRGCPYDCEFCSIGRIMGKKYRVRPVADIISELNSIQSRDLFIVDDAIALNRNNAKQLFSEMIPLKKRWIGQATLSLAEDLDLLKLMKRSGCFGLILGFESVDEKTQDRMRKTSMMKLSSSDVIKRFHGEGIPIMGSFIFGFDNEKKDIFDRTLEYCLKHHVDVVSVRIICPFPGTRLYDRLLEENRLLEPEWWLKGYKEGTLLFHPKGMTLDEFEEGWNRIVKHIYSYSGIFHRLLSKRLLKRSIFNAKVITGVNLTNRKRYFKGLSESELFP
jgi:radical SAM superfamily enzyme YgiQ (UPF0313 family)